MKKVILLLPSDSSFRKPLETAFKKLGWDVKFFDYRRGSTEIRLLRFLPIIGGRKKANDQIQKRIIALTGKYKPDLILTVKAELLEENLFKKIKRTKTKVVNWFPDPMNLWDLMVKIAPYYDYFFHFDPLIIRRLKSLGNKNILYLPFAAEIQKEIKENKIYDVSFIGTYSKYRETKLANLKGFKLNIWGDPRWQSSALNKFARGGRIHQSKMKRIIKKSKINLNIHYNAPREGANLRTFEVTGTGGFLLTDYVKDLGNLFKLNKEIGYYRSQQDLQKKLDYYLKNEKIRGKIAQEGYQRANESHNYLKRVKELLKLIEDAS